MVKKLKVSEVKQRLGLESDADVARLFGVTRSAVAQWDGVLPEMQQMRLQYELRPDVFGPQGKAA